MGFLFSYYFFYVKLSMVFVLHGLDDFTVFKSGTRTLERIESIGSAESERKHEVRFL